MTTNWNKLKKTSKRKVAMAGVNCEDRLWVIQRFWSIFYGKITKFCKTLIFGLWSFIGHPYNHKHNKS